MSLAANRDTQKKQSSLVFSFPVAASAILFAGAFAMLTAGYAAPGATGAGTIGLGRVKKKVDNTGGADGVDVNGNPIYVEIEPGTFRWVNGDSITQADVGKRAFFGDDQTAYKSSAGGTRSYMGIIVEVDSSGVWVYSEPGSVGVATAISSALSNELNAGSAVVTDEWTNPAAVSTTALKAATTFTTDPQTILAAALSAPGVAALAAYPRNPTFTGGGTTADAPTQVVVTGTDIDDAALTETVALTAGSGACVKAFKTTASYVFTGATSNDSTVAIGIGKKFGLSESIKSRAGLPNVLSEVAIGVAVATGTVASAATSPPHGTYAPSANPNGTTDDFALTYEQDLA